MPSTAGIVSSGIRYQVGNIGPSGGYVVILPSSSGNSTTQYFEIPKNDWNGGAADPSLIWGSTSILVSGLTAGVGKGATNTALIIAQDSTSNTAARKADALTYGGYSDWFLPSMAELRFIYDSRSIVGTSNNDNYKSSEQGSANPTIYNAAIYFFNGTDSGADPKQVSRSTRPMRSFFARY